MARTKAPSQAGSPATPKRVRRPVGSANRLEIINQDPGRVYRLVNADPNRIHMFEQAGWIVEKLEDHVPSAQRVDQGTSLDNAMLVGSGHKQVLMSIEREFYDEDQRAKRAKLDELDRSLKPKNSDGFYGDIKPI